MTNKTTTLLTLVQESVGDDKPLILGAVGVGLGGLAILILAFKQFAPTSLTVSPLFQKLAGLFRRVEADLEQKVMTDPSSLVQSVKDIAVSITSAANIQVDRAHLADIQAMLQLMGKPHVVTSEPAVIQDAATGATGPTDSSIPGTMYSTI